MDYAKNFKAKDVILRIAAYVLYFYAAGFIGNLCAMLAEPIFSLVLKQYPEVKNIVLYALSVAAALAALSYFSRRDGYADTELLRFSYRRTVLSYITSALIFSLAGLYAGAPDYFFAQCVIPAEIHGITGNYVFMPGVPFLYNAAEYIKYILALKWANLYLYIFICVLFCAGFYKSGRSKWIAEKKSKIKNYK